MLLLLISIENSYVTVVYRFMINFITISNLQCVKTKILWLRLIKTVMNGELSSVGPMHYYILFYSDHIIYHISYSVMVMYHGLSAILLHR